MIALMLAFTITATDLHDLEHDKRLSIIAENHHTDLPKDFAKFKPLLDFDAHDCRHSILKETIRVKKTGEIFTAYYTNEDTCDGGNSYGFIVEGREARASKVRYLIQDSWILEKKK